MKRISVSPSGCVLALTFSLAILGLLAAAVPVMGNPLSTGACCFADGSCTVLTQPDCAQQGGVWQGEDTSCTPNPCPDCLLPCVTGACCLPNGHCEWVIQSICQQDGGAFLGGCTLCMPNPCGTAAVPDPPITKNIATWGKIKTIYR